MNEIVSTPNSPGAIGPYSQAVISNGFIFVSGQLPVNPENNGIPEGIAEQTKQSLTNLKSILESAGCTLSDAVKVTVFLKDMKEFSVMNEVYEGFFTEPYPARVAVEVARLPMDAKVEIEAVASI